MRVQLLPFPTRGIVVSGHTTTMLANWSLADSDPGSMPATWSKAIEAHAPGTVAGARLEAGLEAGEIDSRDWWYRCRTPFAPAEQGQETVLRLDGLATIAEAWIGETRVLTSTDMFLPSAVAIEDLGASGGDELRLVFRALAPVLAQRHPRPRWKTRIVAEQSLRWHRTTLLGRLPGFAPGPPPVGPWRTVALEHRSRIAVDASRLRPSLLDDGVARLDARLELRELDTCVVAVEGRVADFHFPLTLTRSGSRVVAEGTVSGRLSPWWPHTHGDPSLHPVSFEVRTTGDTIGLDAGRVGFRRVSVADQERFSISINGVSLFCRGGSLLPDPVTIDHEAERLETLLQLAVDAGMNMLRLPGLGAYADDRLLTRCDELGLMLWQDFSFANMDYPVNDPAFRGLVESEAAAFLEPAGRHASLTVLCGGSEIEQQPAMLGITADFPLLDEVLPESIARAKVCIPFVRSTPSGGDLPFRPNAGVAHYFGVGAYRRPLDDARRAEVRFAAECLAFANVPEPASLTRLTEDGSRPHPLGNTWKRGVPYDVGADWDFDDVRDHYLRVLFGLDPQQLCASHPSRYVEVSRAVTGEVMARTIGEWRRAASPCSGALVWSFNDLLPGIGWGVIDAFGMPKPAYWHLRRACRPVGLWMTDEGTNGLALHIANDRDEPLNGRVTVAFARADGRIVESGACGVTVSPHGMWSESVESVIGHFIDASSAYRFGPPAFDIIVAELHETDALIARDVHLSPTFRLGEPDDDLELRALVAAPVGTEPLGVTLDCARVAYSVRVDAPGFTASDSYFTIPGGRVPQHSPDADSGRCIAGRDPILAPERTSGLDPRDPAVTRTFATVFGDSLALRGWLTLPSANLVTSRGVVIVAPFWHPNICSYRPLWVLAQRLAAHDHAVLRFDWPGQGDSADPIHPITTPDDWSQAVREAIAHLRSQTGVVDVALVGLRIGATVALTVADDPSVASIALISPFVDGSSYIRETRAFEALTGVPSVAGMGSAPLPRGTIEASGFLIQSAEAEALRSLDLRVLDSSPTHEKPILLAAPSPDDPALRLRETFGSGTNLTLAIESELSHLDEGTGRSALTPACGTLVESWLGGQQKARGHRKPKLAGLERQLRINRAGIVETGTLIGPGGAALALITCEPEAPRGPWVVFLNAGSVHHVGPNRLWTTFGRRWAESGIPSARIDASGFGDSDPVFPTDERAGASTRALYTAPTERDVRAVLDWLTETRGPQEFVLVGLCSGAYFALRLGARDRRVVGVGLLNPRAIVWDSEYPAIEASHKLADIARHPSLWRGAIVEGRRPSRRLAARGVTVRALHPRRQRRIGRETAALLSALPARGGRCHLALSDGDSGHRSMLRLLGPDLEDKLTSIGVTYEIFAGVDHTFRPLWSHDAVRRSLERHLALPARQDTHGKP